MMRSLYSGVSGLRVHQTKMDVIANNISNVNTVGFKRSTVVFSDVFNQTLSGATGANEDSGRSGTNAQQIGLGSTVAAISNIMTTGATQRTDNGNDIMISGDGFFIVSDSTGYKFTRAGAFEVDEEGNLHDSNGLMVCGWEAEDDPDNPGQQKIVQANVQGLNLYRGSKSYVEPEVTSTINFEGNLNPDTNPEKECGIQIYDSLGNVYKVNGKFTYTGADNTWKFTLDGTAIVNGDSKNTVTFNFTPNTINIQFDENGKPTGTTSLALTGLSVTPGAGAGGGGGAGAAGGGGAGAAGPSYNATFADPVNISFADLTQFNAKADATAVSKDGCAAGALSGFSIGSDGIITGSYTNGKTKILGQISVAQFKNPAGLQKVGSNLYEATVNSGDFDGIGSDITADGGEFISGSLEMSNVDLSQEFVDVITTQRGFQANSRVITTSDEMLQELVNLKR